MPSFDRLAPDRAPDINPFSRLRSIRKQGEINYTLKDSNTVTTFRKVSEKIWKERKQAEAHR